MEAAMADDSETGRLLEEWMSRDDLAAELGVTTDTLQNWQTRRVGPPCARIGRKVLYRREAVREWLRAQEMPNGAAQQSRGRGRK
jgi:hypothetical protein